MQIRIEIRNPQIIRIRHLPCIIHPNHTKRQTPCRLTRLSFNLIHIKRRIRHHIITPSRKRKHIMIKRIRLISCRNRTGQPVNRQIHQTQLRIIIHLLLTVKRHLRRNAAFPLPHKLSRLHKHTARTARRIKQNTLLRLNHIHNHLNKRLRRKENTIIRRHNRRKLT